jgi:hypothetical protein
MMLTMHSILANRYRRRSQFLELSMLAISTVLVALTFVDPQVLSYFNIQADTARVLLGICSILVFFLSIVSLVVNWKGKSTQHREAFNTLISLKSEWREVRSSFDDLDERSRGEFARKSSLILSTLIPIPDVQFNRLKAQHYRKVELSKLISTHPGTSITLLRARLWWRSNRRALSVKLPDEK